VPVTVRENLTWEQVSVIERKRARPARRHHDVGEVRAYPLADQAAHLTGYVGAVSEDELTDDNPVLALPGFKIGKSGVEKILDEELRGSAGSSEIEVNAYGREIRELSSPACRGRRVCIRRNRMYGRRANRCRCRVTWWSRPIAPLFQPGAPPYLRWSIMPAIALLISGAVSVVEQARSTDPWECRAKNIGNRSRGRGERIDRARLAHP